ncbi:MAG TPA: hypothetical protein VFK80_12340, partial [Limnochordia bacterium]|nr:hypothetical protein [Limnochordia bacterium]
DDRLVLHLLSFLPARKHPSLEVVEDAFPLVDVPVAIRSERRPQRVYTAPNGSDLNWRYADGYVQTQLSSTAGHVLVVVE